MKPAIQVAVLAFALAGPSPAIAQTQEVPLLPEAVQQELRDEFFMDAAVGLFETPRSRVEMHEYLTEEREEFFFLLFQQAGDVMLDEFRPTDSESVQSLKLTMEMPAESLRMVELLLLPEAAQQAESLIEGAIQSVDQGGPNQTKLYLLGIHEVAGTLYQVLLRQEISSAGTLMYWIHFF